MTTTSVQVSILPNIFYDAVANGTEFSNIVFEQYVHARLRFTSKHSINLEYDKNLRDFLLMDNIQGYIYITYFYPKLSWRFLSVSLTCFWTRSLSILDEISSLYIRNKARKLRDVAMGWVDLFPLFSYLDLYQVYV